MASTSNVDLSESQTPALTILTSVMTALATLAIIFRLWARLTAMNERRLWWDDYLAVAAWVFGMTYNGMTFRALKIGLGKHAAALKPESVTEFLTLVYFGTLVWALGVIFTKFSALLFYRRIFSKRNHRFTIAYWFTVGWVVAFSLVGLFSGVFVCVPPKKYWNHKLAGKCINEYTNFGMLLFRTLLDVITDLMILILPLPFITGLKIPKGRKVALFIAFFCGYAAWITSIGRMGTYITTKDHLDSPDMIWYDVPNLGWSIGEMGISIFSICIPPTIGLFRRYTHGGFSSLFTTKADSNESSRRRTPNGTDALSMAQSLAGSRPETKAGSSRASGDSVDQLADHILKAQSFNVSFQSWHSSNERLKEGSSQSGLARPVNDV